MRHVWLLALAMACDSDQPLPPTDQAALAHTLDVLAQMGEKQAGTAAGAAAAEYIRGRFAEIGLSDVHFENFQFPRWKLLHKSMTITIDGVPSSPAFDVFEASGGGIADGPIVDVSTATDADLIAVDLTGKIAMVKRDASFHRSSQLRNVTAKGAAALLYLSVAPENLRQVGSVRLDWEAAATIPAITIGADDATTFKNALSAGKTVRAQIDVAVASTPGTGIDVVGTIKGERPEIILLGAHYDTWFAGSSDNGSGVAELLAIAERRMKQKQPHYTLVFVAYDGEEIGLYGGYDFYRKHRIVANAPILVALNFECPSAVDPDIAAVVHSNQPKLDEALQLAHLRQIYSVYAGLEIVAQIFGGIIPTDIQGVYRGGTPAATTAVTNPYYHTIKDTPEAVDLQLLADSTDAFDAAINYLGKLTPADFAVADPYLWTADVTLTGTTVDATVRDASGAPQANARVRWSRCTMTSSCRPKPTP